MEFLGIEWLDIEYVVLWNIRAFGLLVASANVNVKDVTVDDGGGSKACNVEFIHTDGLHFAGPVQYASIDTVRIRVMNDRIALNANDFDTDDVRVHNDLGPYIGQGPISDVVIHNVMFMAPACAGGIRLLSSKDRIDRIRVEGVMGAADSVLNLGHFRNPTSLGNIGRVTVSGVSVDRPAPPPLPVDAAPIIARIVADRPLYGDSNGADTPYIKFNAHIETSDLRDISTTIAEGDHRPVIRLGPDAHVGLLSARLTVDDPSLSGTIVRVDGEAMVKRFNLGLSWQGR